jgi:hypothetical protein
MKPIIAKILIFFVFSCASAFAAEKKPTSIQSPPAGPSVVGRFQLISGKYPYADLAKDGKTGVNDGLFLLDTMTGEFQLCSMVIDKDQITRKCEPFQVTVKIN